MTHLNLSVARHRLLTMLCLTLLNGVLMLSVGAAGAMPVQGTASPIQLVQANGVSLEQAVAQVQRRIGGRVLSAETRMEDGVPVHHVRVLMENQRVRTVRVDGQTGQWR